MRRFLLFVLLLLALGAVLLAPSYLRYLKTRGATPPGVRLAGLAMGDASATAVSETLNQLYDEPVIVFYGDQRLTLRPRLVGFQVDAVAMLAEARAYETPVHLVRLWLGEAIGHPPKPVNIPLRYRVDNDAVDNWLADIASRLDRPALAPRPDLENGRILPGQAGRQLDLQASRGRLMAALADPQTRTANLVFRQTAAPSASIAMLEALLQARIADFPGVAALFLHHTATGDEVAINADVAFSGMSTMKIAILQELYRKLDAAPDSQTTRWITQTVALSGNVAANELLGIIGDGDPEAGVRTLNASLRRLGLKDTFMAAPYDWPVSGPRLVTAANSDGPNTQPDPVVQTTPRDIGLVLEMIVECSQGGGALLAAYAGQVTATECAQILDFLKLNDVTALLVSGLPDDARAVHKHGYVATAHGDVAAIWGAAGPYVLSVFLYRPHWLEWDFSSETMGDLSAIVWYYFQFVSRQ